MADKNVQFRVKNGTIWDALFPETTLEQIVGSTTAGRNLLGMENPETEESFIKVTTLGAVSFVAKSEVAEQINASPIGHGHSIADVNIPQVGGVYNGKTLQEVLDAKATIVGGLVSDANLPAYLFSGMKFKRMLGATQTLQALVTEYSLPADVNIKTHQGFWFESSANTTITFDSTCEVLAPGDEGDYASGMIIEAGDWLIYRGYSGTKHQFSIGNNNYGIATEGPTGHRGVVRLSPGTITTRAQLASGSDGEKVIDEKALRAVMKDIHYGTTTPTADSGDFWIYG